MSPNTDGIAQIQKMEDLEALFANDVFADIHLNPSAISLDVSETSLAHQAVRDDASGHPHFDLLRLKVRRTGCTMFLHKLRRIRRPAKLVGVRVQTRRTKLFQLLQPLLKLVPWLEFQVLALVSIGLSRKALSIAAPELGLQQNCWFYFGTLVYSSGLQGK
ncbi:MAG: hypothetical protein NVS9B14_18540 [Candidatus Acidiferrum sp.]